MSRAQWRRTAFASLIAAASVAAFCGCKTLPLPSTPDDSLVIFSTEITDESVPAGSAGRHITIGELVLINADTHRSYSVYVYPAQRYAAAALPAGQYTMAKLILRVADERNHWEEPRNIYGTFYVQAGTVQLCMRGLGVYRAGNGYSVRYLATNAEVYAERRKDIRAALTRDRRWLAWEEYQLINLE